MSSEEKGNSINKRKRDEHANKPSDNCPEELGEVVPSRPRYQRRNSVVATMLFNPMASAPMDQGVVTESTPTNTSGKAETKSKPSSPCSKKCRSDDKLLSLQQQDANSKSPESDTNYERNRNHFPPSIESFAQVETSEEEKMHTPNTFYPSQRSSSSKSVCKQRTPRSA